MAFIQVNENPKNLRTQDCVIRALSKATGKSWDDVYKELCDIGFKKKRLPNDSHVYKAFLKQYGFESHNSERDEDGKRISVLDFSNRCDSNKVYVIHTRKHLTVIYKNDIYDTWNTSYETTGKYYSKSI